MMYRDTKRRSGVAWLALCACVVAAAFTTPRVAMACFGYLPPPLPPMPVCFKTYVYALSGPNTILANPGGTVIVELDELHVVQLAESFPSTPICPPGPFTVTQTADVVFDNGAVMSGIPLTPDMVGTGNTPSTDTLTLPGDAACAEITVTSTITIGSWVRTQIQKQEVCIVDEPFPGAGVPRLELVRVSPGVSAMHPGDQTLMCYELTNHDPVHPVTVDLGADMRNVAGQPLPFDRTNTMVISDPVDGPDGDVGDNFPIEFDDLLPAPFFCVPLPPNPELTPIPLLVRTYMLMPNETITIKIATRAWPMCADGSCGQSLVVADGLWDDGTNGKACASAIALVDNASPPQFLWPDAGTVGLMGPDPLGGTTGVGSFGFPFPTAQADLVDVCVLPQPLPPDPFIVGGMPVPSSGQFRNVLADEADFGQFIQRTALRGQFAPNVFPAGNPFEVSYVLQFVGGFEGVNAGAIVDSYDVIPGAPQGLEDVSPGAIGFFTLPVPDPGLPDVQMQLTHQVVASATLSSGDVVPVRIDQLTTTPIGPSLVEVHLVGFVPEPPPSGLRGFPEFTTEVSIGNDIKTYYTPKTTVCVADFDGDGDVDLGDFGVFGAAFGSVSGDANYNAAADFDGDGDVDLGDFGTFGAEFGLTGC